MGNLINTIKKFIANKNTVTILGILAGVIVLWVFYNYRVNKAVSPIKVPYAEHAITARTQITKEDIKYIEISSEFLNNISIITDANKLIGYYVNVGTSIPEGGLFYSSQVVKLEDLPGSDYDDLPEGYAPFQLDVNNKTTFGNSIYPGSYVDIYMRANDNGTILVGKLLESAKVLAVKDSQNQNVFDSNTTRTPALLIFGLIDEQHLLLTSAKNISGVELFPVPRGRNYTDAAGETSVGSMRLVEFIQSRSEQVSY